MFDITLITMGKLKEKFYISAATGKPYYFED